MLQVLQPGGCFSFNGISFFLSSRREKLPELYETNTHSWKVNKVFRSYKGDSSVFLPRNFTAISFNLGNRFVGWKPSLLSLDAHFHLLLCVQQKENRKEKQKNKTVCFYIYLEKVFKYPIENC